MRPKPDLDLSPIVILANGHPHLHPQIWKPVVPNELDGHRGVTPCLIGMGAEIVACKENIEGSCPLSLGQYKIIFPAMWSRLALATVDPLSASTSPRYEICHFRRVAGSGWRDTGCDGEPDARTVINFWSDRASGQRRASLSRLQTSHPRNPVGPAQQPESDPRSH